MYIHRYPLLFSALALFNSAGLAQGCSDAGVCTAGPIGQIAPLNDSVSHEPRHLARFTYTYAVGEQGVRIMQVQPELSMGLTDRLSLQLKIPYISATGNLGDNGGPGDLVSTASYAFIKEHERNLTAVAGLRLPTGRFTPASFEEATFGPSARPLPMPYQLGLGTTDLLLGMQYRRERWSGTAAYQHVLVQNNQSTFLHRYWDGVPAARRYFESYALERANDAVARIQYAVPIKRLTLQPGILAIWHLGKDSRLAIPDGADLSPYRIDIAGSEGLTLNVTADARYRVNDAWSVEASIGTPVITREVRPDGLTRALVTNVGLRYAF
ncbi:MAG: hypothetical protein JNM62_10635 [Flavobacteriales bacterium]|nr:hypothetical protein [Flavobacteriales bacterium]